MNFSQALEFVKATGAIPDRTNRVRRSGWVGHWMSAQAAFGSVDSYLYLYDAASGRLVPWTPAQGDMFAEDWEDADGA